MKRWISAALALLLAFALAAPGFAAGSMAAPVEISLAKPLEAVQTRHIQPVEIQARNTARSQQNIAIVLALADYKGNLLQYAVSEERLERDQTVRLKQYAKAGDEAYEVQIFAWDSEENKTIVSNVLRIPISGGYIKEEIVRLPTLRVTAPQWSVVTLPATVDAEMNTGEIRALPVTWQQQPDTSKPGVFEIEGRLTEHQNRRATLILTVSPRDKIENIPDLAVTVPQGQAFTLPVVAKAEMNTGVQRFFSVKWAEGAEVDTQQAGVFQLEGRVESYDKPVKLTLTVEPYRPDAMFHFVNDSVAEAAADALGTPAEQITYEQIRSVESLYCAYLSDNNLEDLRYFTGLKSLDLSIAGVTDLTPLADLTGLEELNLHGNEKLQSVAPLFRLHNLKNLRLTACDISDYSPTAPYYDRLENPAFSLNLLKADAQGQAELELTLGQTFIMPFCIQLADGGFAPMQWSQDEILASDEGKQIVTGFVLSTGQSVQVNCEIVDKEDYVIQWKDPAVEQGVRKSIGKFNGDIYYSDVKNLQDLDCFGLGVKTLQDLEHMRNLTHLGMALNYLDDSQWVYIKNLTKMEYLDLAMNKFNTIPEGAFVNMPSLIEICLDTNDLRTIEPGAFRGQENLESLLFEENYRLTSINEVRTLVNLKSLFMNDTAVSDLSPLAGLNKLDYLRMEGCPISDISALAGKSELTHLNMGNRSGKGRISDISPLRDCQKLYWLELRGNQVRDISALAGKNELYLLDLRQNQVQDISALASCPALDMLNIDDNQVISLAPLSDAKKLVSLYARNNQISDAAPLAGLSALKNLYLAGNQIVDYSPLREVYPNLNGKDFYF